MLYQIIDANTLKSSAELNMLPNGAPCGNVTAWLESHPEAQTQYGWYVLNSEAVQPETGTYRQRYDLVENVIVMSWEEYVPPKPVFNMLKTLLRRNMTEAGLGDVLNAYLSDDADAKLIWDECIILESNSTLILNAVQSIIGMGLKTEEEVWEILEKSRTSLVV
jgi:hypothetical protein